jgi:hypothetical protein
VDRLSSVGQTLIYPIPSKKGGISDVRTLRRVVIWCVANPCLKSGKKEGICCHCT